MSGNVEAQRARARLFDREAERYDRTRPSYPDDLIDDVLGSSPQGLTVLDVACGTGIASRALVKRGAQVLGVELNPRMAEIARRQGVETEVSAFETWDPAGRMFDRVTCAQAWHWLDPVVSIRKVTSVLREGGRVCLFWSIGSYPDDLADEMHATYERVAPLGSSGLTIGYGWNRASAPTEDLRPVADALDACDELGEPQMTTFPWSRVYSRDEWVDELLSHSDHAALEPELRQRVVDEVGRTIDRFGGSFRLSYVSILISATRA
ncbi:MAG: class I SAM-dependent methyltransferase [Actinobacteria bacterium]|nr:class I SAM-dependent methyltransferase [Actinomycetota bacterium]